MRPCDGAFRTTRALPPQYLQRLDKQLTARVLRLILMRKLPDGEVCLLLAGARPTESHTSHLHHCVAVAGALGLASDLAQEDRHLHLCQEDLPPVTKGP